MAQPQDERGKAIIMLTKLRPIFWLVIFILIVPGIADAKRAGRLIGKVIDPEGEPIAGVSVTVTCQALPDFRVIDTTNKKGIFKVDFDVANVTYEYKFEKVGYATTKASQAWNKVSNRVTGADGTDRHDFVMHPGQSTADTGLPPASESSEAVQAFNAGVGAFQGKNFEEAISKFNEALEFDPEFRQAWSALAMLHFEQEHYQDAATAAEEAIALGSTSATLLQTRWESYRNLGNEAKADEARADLERIGRASEEAKKVYNEGVQLTKAGDDEAALVKFREAVELDSNLQPAQLGVAMAAVKLGHNEVAADASEAILKQDPKHEQALKIRYNACLGLGDEERLLEALQGLAAIDPQTARDSLFRLATSAYDKFETERAARGFARVLEVDPNHPRSHYYLGLIRVNQGLTDEAKTLLNRFMELAPNDPEVANAREIVGYLSES
ncbi:MAG: tetratricopeptide repeat protein [bacterium]|nr:tetratricopeptide repeat protein [bacterium]